MTKELNKEDQQKVSGDNNETEMNPENVVEAPSVTEKASIDVIDLPHGNALSVEETYKITASRKVKFIVLAGAVASGKTTLLTTIYHLLNKGSLSGYWFAGSETLLGFEQRSFLARTSSDNVNAQMGKTRRGILDAILHIQLCKRQSNMLEDLLITDFSGEDLKSISGNVEFAKAEFGAIKRAEFIALLIDGDLISQKKYRNRAEQESLQLLKTICDAGLIGDNTYVDVLISKYDIVDKRVEEDHSLADFIEQIEKRVENKLNGRIKNLSLSTIAAMPEDTAKYKIGYGLEEIITRWIEFDNKPNHIVHDGTLYDNMSEHDLFAIRTSRPKAAK